MLEQLLVRVRRHALAVRTACAIGLVAVATQTVLAQAPAGEPPCCGPSGANACHAAGCADKVGSTCIGVTLTLITGCCGYGDGQAICRRLQPGQPQTAWCVICASGSRCGNCPAANGQTCNPSASDLMNCLADNQTWDYESCACQYSPIVVQLEPRDPYSFTSTAEGVMFDANADGDRERTAWTSPNERQAFLVLDRNGNGLVDSAAELFGNVTPLASGTRAANGFEALVELEEASSAANGVIDSADPIYHQLQLWIDADHDGESDSGELSQLAAMGVLSVSTSYHKVHRYDENGNKLMFRGSVRLQTPHGVRRKAIYDVYFQVIPNGSNSD
jgi:hypothetical protein